MPITLAEIRQQIATTESAIDRVVSGAQSYGKGDRNVQRADLTALQTRLNNLRRDERQLMTAQSGANNPGVISASYNSGV